MPRLGIGMPIISETSGAAVLAVEDFVFLNDVSGELTPVDTSSRTNKILHSQDLKQSSWTKTNSAVASDLYEAPDNSTTANAIQNDATGDEERKVTATHAVVSGETYTLSGHFKKGLYNFVKLYHSDTAVAFSAFFNITTGAVSGASNTLSTSFDKMDDDWIRCSITFQATATGNGGLILSAAPTSSSASASIATGADQDLIYVWGMQLEEDSRPTAYIVTTNAVVNVATNELNDVSNVWDFDGTDIMLEVDPENEGAFEEATANLVTNGDFAADSNWTKQAGWTISGGKAVAVAPNSSGFNLSQSNVLTAGVPHEITFTVSNRTAGGVRFRNSSVNGTTRNTNGTFTEIITPAGHVFSLQGLDSFVGKIDNITVKEYAITPLNV